MKYRWMYSQGWNLNTESEGGKVNYRRTYIMLFCLYKNKRDKTMQHHKISMNVVNFIF